MNERGELYYAMDDYKALLGCDFNRSWTLLHNSWLSHEQKNASYVKDRELTCSGRPVRTGYHCVHELRYKRSLEDINRDT